MTGRLLLISPVRDEARHIDRVARAVTNQTRRPDLWAVVDDGSLDGTPLILRRLAADVPFLRVLRTPEGYTVDTGDRLAAAAVPRAFNWALEQLPWWGFTHIGKLDGDIELPRDYIERIMLEFEREPALGIAAGVLVERFGSRDKLLGAPPNHAPPNARIYRRECFEGIGGIQERLGWDTVDETYARLRGFMTRSLPELPVRHLRSIGTADGQLRGRARHGRCAYIAHYSSLWMLLRSVKVAITFPPVGLSGVAFLWGYLHAAATSVERVEDSEFRTFIRGELRCRLLAKLWVPLAARRRRIGEGPFA